MLIRHPKPFNLGLILAVTFVVVLLLIFSPIFGGKNGLEYADDLFNKLSKGSSYFIPKISNNVQKFAGKPFSVTVALNNPQQVDQATRMLLASGAQVGVADSNLKISGDLGNLLSTILRDSDAMFHNDGTKVSSAYGMNERDVMSTWWSMLNKMNKEFQKEKKIEESNIVTEVMRKGIEPAYNFFGIEAQRVSDKALTMIALLVFYVAYTMWWGYAIFYMFDGIGLSMKKAKVKKEV